MTQGKTSVEVIRVDDRHTAALASFIQKTWDPTASEERVRRARAASASDNPAAHGTEPPTFLLMSGGQPLGHVTTIPIRLWRSGGELPAHWVKGLMVLPEHRNGPVGFYVLKEAVTQLDTALAMVVQPAPRKLFQALGFTDLGAMPNYLRVLDPVGFLRRLDLSALGLSGVPAWARAALRFAQRSGLARVGGAAAAATTRLWILVAGGRKHRLEIRTPEEIDRPGCDELWQRVRSKIAATPTRDAAYLDWRYKKSEPNRYSFGAVYEDGRLAGIAVVRRPRANGDPRLAGLRVATLSDLLFPPDRPRVGLAVLAAAETVARRLGADALLFSCSHSVFPPLLKRRAFAPLPGNVHPLIRAAADAQELPTSLGDWWLTRGDSSADEVF